MSTASFIFSPCIPAGKLEFCVGDLLSLGWRDVETVVFQNDTHNTAKSLNELDRKGIITVNAPSGKTPLPGLLNRAVARSSGDVLVFVADCVRFSPEFLQVGVGLLLEKPFHSMLYGPFLESFGSHAGNYRDVRTDSCDFSEGSQLGPVRAVTRAVFDAVGGFDENLRFAFEYDLRLKLLERGEAVRMDSPLYTVFPVREAGGRAREHRHFLGYVRSDPTTRARSYLDYPDDEEGEFRDTCCRALKRRGAFLTESRGRFRCPHPVRETPSISVVIPLWNREDYIGPALQSALKADQGPFEFEVIVVDNGSCDTGMDVVREQAKNAPAPVRLLHNETNNIAGALNIAIRASGAKYICQLDSDDLYTPETLKTLVHYMETNPQAALGVSYYDCVGPDGAPLSDRGVVRHLEYGPNNLMRTDGVGHARIWHRCVLEELGGFDEENLGNYAEDYDLQLKLCEHYEILRIPHVLYHYRMNHKKPGETISYAERHQKKTWARRAAIERRQTGKRRE